MKDFKCEGIVTAPFLPMNPDASVDFNLNPA